MATYDVHFDVNGTVHSLECQSTKVGNRFLQCFGNVRGDSEKIAFIPFDSIEYIAHMDATINTIDSGPSGSMEDSLVELTDD